VERLAHLEGVRYSCMRSGTSPNGAGLPVDDLMYVDITSTTPCNDSSILDQSGRANTAVP